MQYHFLFAICLFVLFIRHQPAKANDEADTEYEVDCNGIPVERSQMIIVTFPASSYGVLRCKAQSAFIKNANVYQAAGQETHTVAKALERQETFLEGAYLPGDAKLYTNYGPNYLERRKWTKGLFPPVQMSIYTAQPHVQGFGYSWYWKHQPSRRSFACREARAHAVVIANQQCNYAISDLVEQCADLPGESIVTRFCSSNVYTHPDGETCTDFIPSI